MGVETPHTRMKELVLGTIEVEQGPLDDHVSSYFHDDFQGVWTGVFVMPCHCHVMILNCSLPRIVWGSGTRPVLLFPKVGCLCPSFQV